MPGKILLTTSLLLLTAKLLTAQTNPVLVTAGYDSIRKKELFLKLEEQTGFYFFFDIKKLDTAKLSLHVINEPLDSVLSKALIGSTSFHSIDYNNKKVYITSQVPLMTSLPKNFYNTDPGTIPPDKIAATTTDPYKLSNTKNNGQKELLLSYEVGDKRAPKKALALIQGIVRNGKTGEPLTNASILIDNRYSAISNQYGEYSISIPPGKYSMNIMAIGIREFVAQVEVFSDGKLSVDLQEQVATLKEVIVSARKTSNIRSTQMGMAKLDITSIKRIPALFGEADILRAITTLPGVKTVGEASTGFNVRGGSTDQNLILYNDGTIYNPSHFFGMFSAFNPDIIKDVELFKSTIPAKYGGRLASVLNVTNREGNKKKLSGSAGIGAITSRLHLEGPIGDKTSFIFGGRTTYANWLIDLLPEEYEKSRASFQDINLGISHNIDSSNNLYFSGYYSRDKFSLNNDTAYKYNNQSFSAKWKRSITKRLQGELIGGYDQYQFATFSTSNEVNAYRLAFRIRQLFARLNFSYFRNQQHSFDFGLSALHYKLDPGTYTPEKGGSLVVPDTIQTERAFEGGAYFTHIYSPTTKLSFSTGLRYSFYSFLGPKTVSYYAPGEPVIDANKTSVVDYASGKFIKNYGGPEVRFSARYAFTQTFSIKAGYNSQRQYIHMLSNTTAISPTDIWKLSDPNIRPQQGQQVSIGFYKNLKSNTIEASLEFYYKKIKDYLDYKAGAKLILNHNIETDVIRTQGKAYGAELLVKKTVGKLTGWISYTYSRILLHSDDPTVLNPVNGGKEYPANYDKPHDVTMTGSFRINHRFGISVNSTYSTGRPITYPIGRFYYAGSQRVLYSERNQHRIPDYFRTDISLNVEGNHKVNKLTHNSWTFGCYNVLGRKNPYSVYFLSENGTVNGYKLSIFGNMIPFVNYNIRF